MLKKDMANRKGESEKKKAVRVRRPPPLHQGVLDEAVARLGLRDVTVKPLFGGLCYYIAGRPFAILLGSSLALKLPAMQLRQARAQGDGDVFRPGGGDFTMREYLDLSAHALMDEERIDTHVQASHRFVAGQGAAEGELNWGDLLQGRSLYQQAKQRKREGRFERHWNLQYKFDYILSLSLSLAPQDRKHNFHSLLICSSATWECQ
jgi:hypothetical protein